MTKQPSLQYEMVGDALKKPQQSLKGRMQFKCKKRRKKYPERKKSSSYALKKILVVWSHSGQNYLKRASPSAPERSNRRVMENHVHPRCQAEVWTALSVESRVSSCLKTHILGWYWIYSPEIFKVWHSGRLETTSFVWLAQLWVKQHPDNLSLISIWFLSLSLFFVSTSKARKIEHW